MEKWCILIIECHPPSPPWASVTYLVTEAITAKHFPGRSHGVALIILCSCSQKQRMMNLVDLSFTSPPLKHFAWLLFSPFFFLTGVLEDSTPEKRSGWEESPLWCSVWGVLCSWGCDSLPSPCSCLLLHSSACMLLYFHHRLRSQTSLLLGNGNRRALPVSPSASARFLCPMTILLWLSAVGSYEPACGPFS